MCRKRPGGLRRGQPTSIAVGGLAYGSPSNLARAGGELIRAIGDALPDDLEIAVALLDLRRDRLMADPGERLGVDALFTLRLAHAQRCDIYAIGDQPAACGRRARTPLLRRSTRALRSIENDRVECLLELSLRFLARIGIHVPGDDDSLAAHLEDPDRHRVVEALDPPIVSGRVLPEHEQATGQRCGNLKLDVRRRVVA